MRPGGKQGLKTGGVWSSGFLCQKGCWKQAQKTKEKSNKIWVRQGTKLCDGGGEGSLESGPQNVVHLGETGGEKGKETNCQKKKHKKDDPVGRIKPRKKTDDGP